MTAPPPSVKASAGQQQKNDAEMRAELSDKGHVACNRDAPDAPTLPSGNPTRRRLGAVRDGAAFPTLFKVYCPSNRRAGPHTGMWLCGNRAGNTQRVAASWRYAGDVRAGLANQAYEPLAAGPQGATAPFPFSDGHWPAAAIGGHNGSTLGGAAFYTHFFQKNKELSP